MRCFSREANNSNQAPSRTAREISNGFRVVLGASLFAFLALSNPRLLVGQQAQGPSPITLRQAVNIALEKNPDRKTAMADTKAASAGVREARSRLLPQVTFSETATRGNDPVYVFGSKLRQQRFRTADFALNLLNTPTPFGDFTTRFGATWNLFDSFASWRAVTQAEHAKEAAGHQLARADQEVVFNVVGSYDGLLLAQKQAEVAEHAVKTAQAILERSKNRFETGLVVESDYLTAQVRFAARQQELIRAENNVAVARAQLNMAMGVPFDTEFAPGEALAECNFPSTLIADAERLALEARPDLKRLRAVEAAQQQSVSIVKSSFGPKVNAFVGWEADNPTFLTGRGGNNWLAGIEVRVDLFQGGAKRAQLAHERALEQKLRAAEESAANAIRLEVRRAYYDLDTARQQIDVTRAAVAQSQESLRINQNRYEAGLSTITDLLGAEEAARRSQADYWDAVYRCHTSYANLQLASGTLSGNSPVVTP